MNGRRARARRAEKAARRAVYIGHGPSSGRTEQERIGLALRAACAMGRCPECGAVPERRPHPRLRGAELWLFAHEAWCRVLSDEQASAVLS